MSNPTTRFVLPVLLAATSTAAAEPPKWCKTSGIEQPFSYSVHEALSEDYGFALPSLVAETCFPDNEAPAHAKELADARAKWSRVFDLTEDDWADVAIWSKADQSSRMSLSTGFTFDEAKLPLASLSATDQYRALTHGPSAVFEDPHYIADALDGRLTEPGRLGYIEQCLTSDVHPVQWAVCQPDIDAFDERKFAADLRADTKADPYLRFGLRAEYYHRIKPRIAKHVAQVKELIAKDPGYAKTFEIAAAQRKVLAGVDPALVDMAFAMDEARRTHSNRAYAGCEDKVWPAWQAAVAALPASKLVSVRSDAGESPLTQAAQAIVQDPAAYLATIALISCAGRDHTDHLMSELAGATSAWPGARGPRTAAASAIYLASIEFDDRDAKLDMIEVRRMWKLGPQTGSGSAVGVVAKVKKTDDGAVIEFKKTTGKQSRCTSVKETKRIRAIDTSGNFVYESICVGEHLVTVDTTPDPLTVDAHYLDGVKPGAMVEVIGRVVAQVWPKSGAKVPSHVAGVKLK